MIPNRSINASEALIKARTFCNYRDRCHKEVREKLFGMGLWKKDVDAVMMQLMDEDLLNEERFARSYARGYFRMKRWGKQRIRMELKQRQINDRLIEIALTEIDAAEYQAAIEHLSKRKLKEIGSSKTIVNKQKVINFLLRKGYTFHDIQAVIQSIFGK